MVRRMYPRAMSERKYVVVADDNIFWGGGGEGGRGVVGSPLVKNEKEPWFVGLSVPWFLLVVVVDGLTSKRTTRQAIIRQFVHAI